MPATAQRRAPLPRRRPRRPRRPPAALAVRLACSLTLVLLVAVAAPRPAQAAPLLAGLHVSGNQLRDGADEPVRLLGVNRSGSEYACVQGRGIFDGEVDEGAIRAIVAWQANVVRVPLNEDCWLGINGVPAAWSGEVYQAAIRDYVDRLNAAGLAVILDLHWTAPGTQQATGQRAMPDRDHAPTFWAQVASAYKDNSGVLFDLFGEPYPDDNRDTPAAWACWRDGGACPGLGYTAAGMQELLQAVRDAGAPNVVLLAGVGYGNPLSRWLTYAPSDPAGNLGVAWHSYNFSWCHDPGCWNEKVAPVAAQVPLVAVEIGEDDCGHGYIDPLMAWLDARGASYLAWAWNQWDCARGPALIAGSGHTPTQSYGQTYHDHLAALAAARTCGGGPCLHPPGMTLGQLLRSIRHPDDRGRDEPAGVGSGDR